jgi:hypothetical protein
MDKTFTELPDFFSTLLCKDRKVYVLTDILNCILVGVEFTEAHKNILKDYPNSIKVIEYFSEKYRAGTAPAKMYFTPGRDADVESFAAEILRVEEAIENGRYTELSEMDSYFND